MKLFEVSLAVAVFIFCVGLWQVYMKNYSIAEEDLLMCLLNLYFWRLNRDKYLN
jgi:hypothetical protein